MSAAADILPASALPVVNTATLDNGLRLVHSQDTATAMVGLTAVYDVGSRDEDPELTGLAHLFEHMMFGGTEHVPDFDSCLTAAGGENNAFTGNDFTTYYAAAPAHNAETLFYLESDRMLCPSLSQATLDVQRSVVIEEFKQQCLNRPYGDTWHRLRPVIYGKDHPYSWPVIGKEFAHIERVTRQDLLDWHRNYYMPSNAVVAVTGNIDFDTALAYARKWFGGIPDRRRTPRAVADVMPLAAPRWLEATGRVPSTDITVAYLMDPYGTDGYIAADAMTDVLASGRASRFYRRLVADGDGLFSEANASIMGSEHQGVLMLTARLADTATDAREAARRLIDEARTVVTEGVSDYELQRLKNTQRSMWTMGALDFLAHGQRLAMCVMHGEEQDAMLRRYHNLSAEAIVGYADRLFRSVAPAVLIYRPDAG